jgi:asparagine synthase (glutamine-hydrolysing)
VPGIVGILTRLPRVEVEPQLKRMVQTLCHEPFYETGTWMDPSLGAYVGWAARKGSFSDGMPLLNEAGDVVLVFSGEEYPEPGITRLLKSHRHVLEPDTPAYLVHLYEEDPAFPAGLNGEFHGLLSDRSRRTAMLFNDRYGMHRIYYHQTQDALYFAAEAKAILAVRPELRSLDPQALGEFLSCGCVLENRTLFKGIKVLPPGSAWTFRNGLVEAKRKYFEPREWEEQEPLQPEAWYQELREVFARNLPRYFNGREPIGMSLTGGLDGRMIMAWHKAAPGSLPCYTFGGTYRDCRDVTVARRVAKACGQPHQVITVGKDFLSRFPHYAERTVYLSDGCAVVSRAPALYANEKARNIASVRMTGNYGSEVLRANRAFKPEEPLSGLFCSELLPYFREAKGTYAALVRTHPVSFAVFRQAPWCNYAILAVEQSQISMRSPYLDNDIVRTVFRAPQEAMMTSDACLRLIADGNPALRLIRADRGLAGNQVPVTAALARTFHEFTFKAEYAYDYGMPQWVAGIDHALSPLRLERLFLGRHKFYHFRVWYREALADYVREMLLDRRALSRPYLDRNMLDTIIQSHLGGNRNYTTEIHKVLTLELLHRLFLDPGCSLAQLAAPERLALEPTASAAARK